MATKITQDGFDGELEKESESKDCQFPSLRLFTLESLLSPDWFVDQMEFHILKK